VMNRLMSNSIFLSSPDGFLDPGQIAGAGADLRSSLNGFGPLSDVNDGSGQLVSGLFRSWSVLECSPMERRAGRADLG
jgi:hypothetical protein